MNEELTVMVEPIVEGLGYDLWGIEYLSSGRFSTLKIYIDSDKGIEVDDCAAISRQVSGLFDVEEPIKGKYTLEVSSPGMDRRLFKLQHFETYKGSQVKINLRLAYEGKRKFTGLLCGIEAEDVVLRVGDEEYLFPHEDIDKANVIPTF